MENREDKRKCFIEANFVSKLLLSWVSPLVTLGAKRPLTSRDLYQLKPSFTSNILASNLSQKWNEEKDKKQPSLGRAMYKLIRVELIFMGFLTLFQGVCRASLPWQICQLIGYFQKERTISERDAFLYATGITVASLAVSLSWQPYFFYMNCLGMKLRVAVSSLIFDKTLKLNYKEKRCVTSGEIVNFMSNDANRLDMCMYNVHFIWLAPLETCLITAYMYYHIGVCCLAAALVSVLVICLQAVLSKLSAKFRASVATLTGSRVGLMAEIIGAIELIKVNVWQDMFVKKIEKIRRKETKCIHKASMVRACTIAPVFSSAKIMVFACLSLNAIIEANQSEDTPEWLKVTKTLSASDIFLLVAVCNMVRTDLVRFLPAGIQLLTEARVSVGRIQKFLLSEESETMKCGNNHGSSVMMSNYCTKWRSNVQEPKTSYPKLENINLSIKQGGLVAIIGSVASGKSSLLSAIMQQFPVESGSGMHIQGDVSLSPQKPWIFPGSVKENILFGREYNVDRFSDSILKSAFMEDILSMPHGIDTQVGDSGSNLSGGQKVRLSIARSIYDDHDIYLLDDPFSALDSKVTNQILHGCILGKLRDKTRIIVTHQTQYLKYFDKIVIMKEGCIEATGTYEQLKNLIGDVYGSSTTPNKEPEVTNCQKSMESKLESVSGVDEMKAKSSVPLSMYYAYFSAGVGGVCLVGCLLLDFAALLTYACTDWWLSEMANIQDEPWNVTRATWFPRPRQGDYVYNISVYSIIVITMVTCGMSNAVVWFSVLTRASASLHARMLACVAQVRMKFFHNNTRGAILNRFSNDLGQLDEILPMAMYDYMICVQTVFMILLICSIVNFWIVFPTIPLLVLFVVIRRYYLKSSRNIKRMEAAARSPVYALVTSSFAGLSSIRAFHGAVDRQRKLFRQTLDNHSEAWFIYISVSKWLAVRLDVLCALFIGIVVFGSVLMAESLNSGLVGWTLTSVITLMGLFQYGVRQSAEVENQMTSVERVVEYTHLESEEDVGNTVNKDNDSSWPEDGSIEVESACMKYNEHTLALNNISLHVHSGEKIGIIGRTGAGKTSLVSMLFRLQELSSGRVLIANQNTRNLNLSTLRSNIAIIPQDSLLFSGTIKDNLDPMGTHTDLQIWNSLELVRMKACVAKRSQGLYGQVGRAGENFSVGQRQLLCLSRALLTQRRIVVIDEATANIDLQTEEFIQQTIREQLNSCTVLTIAHRLNTLKTCNRIIIMDKGKIIEFDSPEKLLKKKDFEINSYLDN